MRSLFCLVLIPLMALAADSVVEVTEANTKAGESYEHLDEVWRAVGMLQQQNGANSYALYTGFFIDSDRFVTVSHPSDRNLRIDCNKEVWVSVGILPAKGELPKQYRCTKVLAQQPELGIAVLELNKQYDHSLKLAESAPLEKIRESFAILGYAADAKIYYSPRCEVTKKSAAEAFAKSNVTVPKLAWGVAKCANKEGMSGSAVLARENNKWVVAGIVFTLGTDRNNIAFSRFSQARKTLGNELVSGGAK